jgi:hypothetical protein
MPGQPFRQRLHPEGQVLVFGGDQAGYYLIFFSLFSAVTFSSACRIVLPIVQACHFEPGGIF